MKILKMFCLLMACLGLQSCKNDKNGKDTKTTSIETDTPVSIECYSALYEKDSIDLKIHTLKDGKITGDMKMKFFNMPEKIGKISGAFRGDTLFFDYEFIEETNDKKKFKNPMALLKRGNELILGNGKIETYLGKSYFVKGSPIDFDRVKFKFTTVDCVVK